MKRRNFKIIIFSVLILVLSCSIGFSGVSALSADMQDIPGQIASVGSTFGIDIGGIIDSFLPSSQTSASESTQINPDLGDDFNSLIEKLGLSSDILKVTDLINYLRRGGSFETWIYDNYGYDIEIPASVKAMSPSELILFLVGTVLNPTESRTETQFTFAPSETSSNPTEFTPPAWSSEPTHSSETPSSEKHQDYTTGDVDGDGRVTAKDARLALRASSQIIILDGAAFMAADVNGDNRITAKDARSILRYSAKISSTF